LYNIGNNQPVQLVEFIEAIEKALGKTAIKEMLPMQPGDVAATFADVSDLETDTGYKPTTSVQAGIQHFIDWYRVYYQV
jgi:UDP-glucuronate 4-epimerase